MVHTVCKCECGRGNPTTEFYIDGKPQIYCYGWEDSMTDEPLEVCKHCPDWVHGEQCEIDFKKHLSEVSELTREEALKRVKGYLTDYFSADCYREVEEIIEALEQEPCDDWYDVPSAEMTFEQARQAVKDLRKKLAEYLDQEPIGDCISRQAVDELSKELVHTTRDKADFLCNFWEGLQKLPSVTPKEKIGWIPVSERLPIEEFKQGRKEGWVYDLYPCLVTRTASHSRENPKRTYVAKHYFDGENFVNNGEEICNEVIAWMPLPEPYKAESEDEEVEE